MKTDREIIDSLLNDDGFRKIVEADIGHPIKVTINWGKNEIIFQGPDLGKSSTISEWVEMYRKQNEAH